ncbi:MAG: hypothetical protein WD229_15175 [Pirellulales bacterium]
MNIFHHRGFAWIAFVFTLALIPCVSLPACAQTAVSGDASPAAVSEPAGDLKTVAVVAGAHYEKLIQDIAMLGSLIGRPETGQMVEGGFALFTQGKGPELLDKKQPWGVIVQTDGAAFLPVGCIPVTNADELLEIATGFGVQVRQANNGVQELVLPNQQSVFLKHEAGWAFISLSPDGLTRLPQNPQATLAEMVTDYDLAARISMKDVPEMYRQFAVQAMQAGMHQQMQQRGDENDDQYELRQKMAEAQMAQMMRTLNETDSITFGWAIDGAEQRTYVDFTQTFLPDSKMAQQIAAYAEARTDFAGFYQPDAAATMSFVTKADPSLIQQDLEYFESMMQTLRASVNNGVDKSDAKDPEALKAAFSDWFDAFEATIKAGQIDGGATLDIRPDSLTFIAGAIVKDTAKLESGLKKLETAAANTPEFPGIQWNAANHAGVNFHTLTVPVPEEQESPRKLLGNEANIAIGIGPEAVYLAVGRDNLTAVKQAIDASAAEPDKAVPPFELVVAGGPIAVMLAEQAEDADQKAIARSVAEMLRNQAQGRDHVRAVGQVIPNGLRYRFAVEEGALRAIGTAATELQRRALQANQ